MFSLRPGSGREALSFENNTRIHHWVNPFKSFTTVIMESRVYADMGDPCDSFPCRDMSPKLVF